MATFENASWNPTTQGFAQSSILGVADMGAIRPDFQEKLFNQFGDQFTKEYELFLRMHGAMKPSQNPQGGFLFQETRYDRFITVGANNGTSTTTLQFNLASGEIEQLGSGYYVYPRVGDTIVDLTTMNRGRITAISVGATTTITATSLIPQNWTTPTAGKTYAIYGNANPENSDGPNARDAYWEKLTYELQCIREAASTTDLALSASLFPLYDEFGRQVGNWGEVGFTQMEFRLLKEMVTTVWLGYNNNVSGQPSTTTGWYTEFSSGANSVNVGPDDYVVHMQDLTDLLLENSPMQANYVGYINRNLNWVMQDDLYTRFENANIVQVREQSSKYLFGEGASEGMMARFDFHTLIMGGMTYNLRLNKISFDPNTLGLDPTSNLFANTAYFVPSVTGNDAEGNSVRNVMLRYLDVNGVSQTGPRRMFFAETGMLSRTGATNRQANRTMDVVSWFGVQVCNMKQAGYFHKNVGS